MAFLAKRKKNDKCNLLSLMCHLLPTYCHCKRPVVQGDSNGEDVEEARWHWADLITEKKPHFLLQTASLRWGKDVAPYLMKLTSLQEHYWQLTAMQPVTRELLIRGDTTKVLPYFILLTVGIVQLLIYLLLLPHTPNMPACQMKQATLTACRILPVLLLS